MTDIRDYLARLVTDFEQQGLSPCQRGWRVPWCSCSCPSGSTPDGTSPEERVVVVYKDLVRRVAALAVQAGARSEILDAAEGMIVTYWRIGTSVHALTVRPVAPAIVSTVPPCPAPEPMLPGSPAADLATAEVRDRIREAMQTALTPISTADLRWIVLAGRPSATTSRFVDALRELVRLGELQRVSGGRGTRYVLPAA